MSKNNLIIGLDIGSANIRSIIAENVANEEFPRIIGVGTAASTGTRRGVVIDIEETARAINESLEASERMAGVSVKEATISVGGLEIFSQDSKGVIAVGRADGEIIEDDINRVINAAQAISIPLNREIIHIIPKNYRVDDESNIKDPLGMHGVRLEVDTIIIEGSSQHLKSLVKSINQAGIEIKDMVLESIAAAKAVLSKRQKELGAVLINIGGGTTSIAVFEEGDLIYTSVLPIGAGHVTNDIAIGLRTSIEVAEKIKLEYGNAISSDINKKDEIDLSQIDSQEEGLVSHFHVAEIIEARLEEIFNLVNKELKSIGKSRLLPGGAIITGGGVKISRIVDLAKNVLGLPAQIGFPMQLGGILDKVDDPSFATAVGLILWEQEQNPTFGGKMLRKGMIDNISRNTGHTVEKIRKWLGKFLP
jgi:cell division protein FtsA